MKGTPITRGQAKINATVGVLHLSVYYSTATGVWGLALSRNITHFGLYGAIAGTLIGLLFLAPIIGSQTTEEGTKEMMFAAGSIWGNIAIIIGVLGIVIWVIRLILSLL